MGETVSVGCKLPNGLHLDLQEVQRDDKGNVIFCERTRFATLKGNAVKHGAVPHTFSGAAYTEVDAAKWAEWLIQNKGSALLVQGMVFAKPKIADTKAQARDEVDRPGLFRPMRGDEVAGVSKMDDKEAA